MEDTLLPLGNCSSSSLFSAGPDELLDHGLDADEGLLADGLDPAGGQQEAEAARVRQLDRVRVRDPQRPLRPVVAPAWKEEPFKKVLCIYRWAQGLVNFVPTTSA